MMNLICNCETNLIISFVMIQTDQYDRPYIICPICKKKHYLQKDIYILLENEDE